MRIHLLTVVGGHAEVLPFFLEHYRRLGIESFLLNVHLSSEDDPVRERVRQVAGEFGCPIASEVVGEWFPVMEHGFRRGRARHPDDWFVVADEDELQMYRDDLPSLLAWCDRRGYDHVTGAFVDRLSVDGALPPIDRARPLEAQFPLGAFLTYPLIGGDPRKVVAAKGRVPLAVGQHIAFAGEPCPIEDQFVQVHHFKWTAGLANRLRQRARYLRETDQSHWVESDRFVEYIDARAGRIDVSDVRFLAALCEPGYPHWRHWGRIVEMVIERRTRRQLHEARLQAQS